MRKNKKIIIATDAVNLPFEFGSGTGVQGFDVDLGNEIGKAVGESLGISPFEVKWVKFPFERLLELLAKGDAELVISAISISEERKKNFAFSDPYFESGNAIAKRRDNDSIRDLASLSGKKVGVQSSSTGQLYMESQKTASKVELLKFATLDDALGALNRTEVDAVVGDEPILTYSMYKSFENLTTLGFRITEEKYGVVVRKTEQKLLAVVNETVRRMKASGQLEELRAKWFQNVMEEIKTQIEEKKKQDALKDAPKSITFNFVKTGGNFRMDRLDGFQLNLVGSGGTFSSRPILTEGNRGSCSFPSPVPPGEYRFSMSIFRLNTTIEIPKIPSRSVIFDMTIGDRIDIKMR